MDRITAAEVFVCIAERASMTAAADTLDMSRAMVTRYLAQMEQWAGARLMHRTTRRLSLTEAGVATLERCRRMLEAAADMSSATATGSDTPRGLLRIACSQSLACDVLASAVSVFLHRHPEVSVDLQIDSRPVNLVQDRIDLAIRLTNDLDPNLIARRLGDCASVICASPQYIDRQGKPEQVQALSTHNCLTYSYFGKSMWEFDVKGDRITVPVSDNLSANEPQVLLSACLEGAGIAMQPLYAAAPHIASGRLVELLPQAIVQGLGVHALYASRKQMPSALRALLDFLADRFADPTHWPAAPAAAPSNRKQRTP